MNRWRDWPRPIVAVLLAAVLFAAVELALQWRSYLRTGQSVLTRLQGESTYLKDPGTGLMLLRPNHVSGGEQQTLRSNSHGLRSPEIALRKPEGTLRIAVLGASTVFGAYAPDNGGTFPALLEQRLRQRAPQRPVEVINAGMVGFGLRDQAVLFDKIVSRFAPDLTVVYPGFNDFGAYCRGAAAGDRWRPQPLLGIELPRWLLSVELLLKNTVPLRTKPEGLERLKDAASLDLGPYRERVRALIGTLRSHGTQVLIARNARSYRPDQPRALQLELSTTARFYNPCFDLDGLHLLYDRHNDAIAEEAAALGVEVLALDEVVPGGRDHFADASHFSERGEQLVADWLAERLAPRLGDVREGRP